MNHPKMIITAISLMAMAAVVFLFPQKKDDPSPLETRDQTTTPRVSEHQKASPASHSKQECKERDKLAKHERAKLTNFWTNNASATFASSRKNITADLGLSAEEAAELDKVFARREAELADLLNGDAADDRETLGKICALLRHQGLREDLAGILSTEKLAAFDANEAVRVREAIEARAYRDMAEINDVVSLTDSQKQQALAALMKTAPANVEQEADARAFMTLHYGQMLTDVDSSDIRGLANMVDAALKNVRPAAEIESPHYQQWTENNKTERIENQLSALKNVLDEKQLTRYREHLEAEPAW